MKAILKPRITFEGRTSLQDVVPLSTPYLVFLDPSDKCNARCSMCPSGNPKLLKDLGRKPTIMDFSLYKKIIRDLADMPQPIKTLRLYADGEPLLNPNFVRMVEYARETGRFGQIDSTSNGRLLTPFIAGKLTRCGLDKLFISIPEIYNKKYMAQISYLFYMSRGSRLKIHTKIIGDKADLDLVHSWLKYCSDFISIERKINCWPNFNAGDDPSVGIYGNALTNLKVCPYPLYSLKINSDGTVSLCFLDYPHHLIIGDLKIESFKSIWNGKKLKAFQVMHLKSERYQHTFCGNCRQLTHGMPDDIDKYAEEILKRIIE